MMPILFDRDNKDDLETFYEDEKFKKIDHTIKDKQIHDLTKDCAYVIKMSEVCFQIKDF